MKYFTITELCRSATAARDHIDNTPPMELRLERRALEKSYTIGRLYIDGELFCNTLEDTVRKLAAGESKVPGKTAIPYGRYRVTLSVKSPKFSKRSAYDWCKGCLPRLLDVPHFDGVLIHAGNTADDTAGCILVGVNSAKGMLTRSMETLKALYARLETSKGPIYINIV